MRAAVTSNNYYNYSEFHGHYLRFTIVDRCIEMCHSREGGRGIGRSRFRSAGEKIQERRCPGHGDRRVLTDELSDNFFAKSRDERFT